RWRHRRRANTTPTSYWSARSTAPPGAIFDLHELQGLGCRRDEHMKIRVERDGLADAVAWVARSLPSRPPVPVLGGVLLDAGSDGTTDALTVSGFDYEVSA